MVQTKKLNASFFSQLQKDLTATIELLRARQDEKQAILDQFDSECKRFFFGKISQRALTSSVKKTNAELQRLDRAIREAITRAKRLSDRERKIVSNQAPLVFRATLSGLTGGREKKTKRRKVAKRKKAKKKRK